MAATLRPHQVNLIEAIDAAIAAGTKRLIAQAPTGSGKTIVSSVIGRNVHMTGRRMIFTVPALSLIDQTVEKFWAEGVRDIGVIQADHRLTNYARPIQIASVQTLQRRPVPAADIVVIDEVHRWFDFYSEWLSKPEWQDVPFIGLSATPWTRGLGKYFNKLIIASKTQELIDAGYLSKFRVFAPASPDLSNVRTLAGDYHEGDLSRAMDKTALVADVVQTWIERAHRRPTLCFAVDRAHAKNLQDKFQAAGISAGYIDAYTDKIERKRIEREFHAGNIQVVCNVGCLTTGIDWDVRSIILARPTKSEMLFVQMVGRGLRTAKGKNDCLILDHSDNHLRLGFVTDIHHDRLDDGRERQKAAAKEQTALPKKCPKCTFLKPPRMVQCPCCGFKPERQNVTEHREGELVEFSSRYFAKAISVDRNGFYRELKSIALDRGYKSGWVAHKFKERFGFFPSRDLERLGPLVPTPATLSWVRSRQIAFAKSRVPC